VADEAKKKTAASEDFSEFTLEKIQNDIRELKEAVGLGTADAAAMFRLATLYLNRERFGDAIKMLESVLKVQPENVEASYLLGNSYLHYEKHEFAARYFTKALKYNPGHLPSLYNLGICYETLGLKSKAIQIFKKFFVLEKDTKWKEEARFRLFKLGLNVDR
jgi:tetratricopeptide (TPR) repeat protein